jgi:hypothetical protein
MVNGEWFWMALRCNAPIETVAKGDTIVTEL